MTFFIALAQLGPLLRSSSDSSSSPSAASSPSSWSTSGLGRSRGRSNEQELDQLHHFSQLVESESTRLLAREIIPFNHRRHRHDGDGADGDGDDGGGGGGDVDGDGGDDGTLLTDLKNQIRHSLVQAKITSQPEVVNAVKSVVINRQSLPQPSSQP